MNWWATWYPGAEPGGGGYIAQRMFSAKDEKNSLLATLWFNIAHFAVRPWPWILVALASLVLFPGLEDPETGYVRVMIAYLPASLRGVMLAAFAAAYMSTIATQLNWGASYVVNDFYRRFVRPKALDKHYVSVSKWTTVLLTSRFSSPPSQALGRCCWSLAPVPDWCCCSAGIGGASMPGAKFRP
jgi:SSS family solute:Na+ symporter